MTLTVRQSVSDVIGRLIVGSTKTYATRTIKLPDALRTQLLLLKIHSHPRHLSSPAAEAVTAVTATGDVTCGTWHAKPPASVRGPMIFGRRVHRS